MPSLIINKAPIKLPSKYAKFVDVFFLDLAFKLFKLNKINDYIIELINS